MKFTLIEVMLIVCLMCVFVMACCSDTKTVEHYGTCRVRMWVPSTPAMQVLDNSYPNIMHNDCDCTYWNLNKLGIQISNEVSCLATYTENVIPAEKQNESSNQ